MDKIKFIVVGWHYHQMEFYEGLNDLNKLETYVNRITNTNAPSTSQARATSGKVGDFGGYESPMEWLTKDPEGYEKSRAKEKGDKFGSMFSPTTNPFANGE